MPNGKALIITEKPSVARDIAKSVGGFSKRDDCLESEKAIITWAVGHLVTLAEPDDYDKRYRFWLLERLPIIPERFQLKVIPKTAARFKAIASLLKRKEVSEVINACDAGREGELIFRYIYEEAGCQKPVRRLWLSSMTDTAIRSGFQHLRPGAEMELLAESAKCRSESDWLVGINATRAFTRRFGMLLSVGRVQTPTLAILVHRELEIQAFLPETYFELFATFAAANGQYQGKWFTRGSDRFALRQEGIDLETKVQNKPGLITSLERKEAMQLPPLLFDLAELQREANRRFGYFARRTLDIAQSLYEKHKLITYPRTDCQYLSSDMIPQLPGVVTNLACGEWEEFAKELLSFGKLPISKRLVDDTRITDHHAIIPTLSKPKKTGLKPEEMRIFDLIVRRFLAAFYPAARWENTRLVTEVEGENFRTEGRKLKDIGWLKVYERPNREELLPDLREGEGVQVVETQLEEKQTAPPPRYNDATLLSAMEGAGKLLDDEELREAMKERGLGTSATRAAIIERLIDVEFVHRENKAIIPTTKGIELIRVIEMIPIPELASPELTGNWEHQLVQIEKGLTRSSHFMEEIVRLTREVVEKVKEAKEVEAFRAAVNEPLGNCPLCGGEIRETKMAYSCSNWKEQGCKFAIWKRIAGKTLTRGQANELLSKGRVGPIFGFRSRAGKPFRAILVLQGEKVTFEFLNDRPAYVRKEKAKAAVEGGSSSSLPSPKRKVVRRKTIAPSLEKAAKTSKKRSPGKTKESKPHSSKIIISQAVDKAPVAKKTVRKRIAVGGTGSKKTTAVDKVDVDKDVLPKKTARTRKNRIAEEEKKEGGAS